jgi:predicted DCC family thiol-disulfide oxidoreductase YuxK
VRSAPSQFICQGHVGALSEVMMPRKSARWAPLRVEDVPDGLVLFDGVCVLCSGWVRFIIERDPAAYFRFAAVQSPYGMALAARLGISIDNAETNAVIEGGRAYFKSDAAIAIGSRLPGWSWVRILSVVPRPLRDFAYDALARSRYRIFGRTDTCLLPTPELAERFVGDEFPTVGAAATGR